MLQESPINVTDESYMANFIKSQENKKHIMKLDTIKNDSNFSKLKQDQNFMEFLKCRKINQSIWKKQKIEQQEQQIFLENQKIMGILFEAKSGLKIPDKIKDYQKNHQKVRSLNYHIRAKEAQTINQENSKFINNLFNVKSDIKAIKTIKEYQKNHEKLLNLKSKFKCAQRKINLMNKIQEQKGDFKEDRGDSILVSKNKSISLYDVDADLQLPQLDNKRDIVSPKSFKKFLRKQVNSFDRNSEVFYILKTPNLRSPDMGYNQSPLLELHQQSQQSTSRKQYQQQRFGSVQYKPIISSVTPSVQKNIKYFKTQKELEDSMVRQEDPDEDLPPPRVFMTQGDEPL